MTQREFSERVLPLRHRLYRLAASLLPDGPSAEDAVQDVLLKLWDRRGELDAVENLEAWCVRVTRNACLDRLRSPRHRTVLLEDARTVPSAEAAPDGRAEWRDAWRRVRALMGALPEAQRTVLQLREIEQYSYREIAEATGQSMDSVKVNLHRARKAVRSGFAQQLAYGS